MEDNNNTNNKKTTSIHTLESDLATAVRDKDYGKNIIKIVTNPDNKDNNTSTKNTYIQSETGLFNNKNFYIYIFSILIFLLILGLGSYYFYTSYKSIKDNRINDVSTTTVAQVIENKPIIRDINILNPEIIYTSDFSKLNKAEIITEIENIKKGLLDNKISINNNIQVKTNLNIEQFFEKIKYSGENSLIRSFEDEYTFGLYSNEYNNFDTYILIKVNDFDLAFKSILYWEKYMNIDLKDIFNANNLIINDVNKSTTTADIVSTTTSTYDTKIQYTVKNTDGFVDKILKNYDTRHYINNEDNVEIIYGFINNKYLLITSSEYVFLDIKNRLLKENIVR